MSKQFLVWKFNRRLINTDSPLFPAEWVCRRDDMHVSPSATYGKTIWLIMTDHGRSYLFGHLVAEKVEQAKNGDGRYILTADARASFRILPRDEDDWYEWTLPRNGAVGIFAATDSLAESIRKMLAENIRSRLPRSRARHAEEKINARAGGIESEYLRVLGEKFYGDLAWGRNRDATPYASLFDSGARSSENLRDMDARILHILRKGFCPPMRARAVPYVDTAFRDADESTMFARKFVAGKSRAFSMDKTQEAEEMHQKIVRELSRALRNLGLSPLCSRSIDLAVCTKPGLLIFEIKSANEKNFETQARSGIIQVLEYKMAATHLNKRVSPVLVISSISSATREEYMKALADSVGVALMLYRSHRSQQKRFFALDEILMQSQRHIANKKTT